MTTVAIPWYPRILMTGRSFRLPVVCRGDVELSCPDFVVEQQRYSAADGAHYFYLRAPQRPGTYALSARLGAEQCSQSIRVCGLEQLRAPHEYNGAQWPRRWPLGQPWQSHKTRQTLQDLPLTERADPPALAWWLGCSPTELWQALPPAERPQAHYVNVTQGCPRCGRAIFAHHGFYPWTWPELGAGSRARCPSCGFEAPSNDLSAGQWYDGACPDDGFGYVDAKGHIYLFAATYHRNAVSAFGAGITALTHYVRREGLPADGMQRLVLMLLRYAQETLYVATAAQFRYGPSKEKEEPWDWGQTDWAAQADPVAALYRKGLLRYSIDVPIVAQSMALAYDTVWPYMQSDRSWCAAANALGLSLGDAREGVQLIEEMLAVQLQCLMDGGGLSNFPRASVGALVLLQVLDREDVEGPLAWLYDRSQERLRTFATNNFFADGTPPEATGGYNDTHSIGLFELEEHLQRLRALRPATYPADRYPSLLEQPRARRIALAPHETVLLGRAIFGFGDGASAGVQGPLKDEPYAPLGGRLLERAIAQLDDPRVRALQVAPGAHRSLGTTIHDGAGIAVLRTAETPERAAVGLVYGDAWLHRHMDLLDVQLFAHGRPFLSDLGYPQSWTSVARWEGHWATHNTGWGVVEDVQPVHWPSDTPFYFLKALAGRGRLRRVAAADGVQIIEVEAERWAWDAEGMRWFRPGVQLRRLLALVETDGDGVALVDMMRIDGGQQHWRCCRGLEGLFTGGGSWRARPGTAAGQDIERGQVDRVGHGDVSALAYMDDVRHYEGASPWQGQWRSRHEEDVHLDVYQIDANADIDLLCARSTATLGAPADSRYFYNGLLWSRQPTPEAPTTHVDLVFEPRVGAAVLAEVAPIAGRGAAAGVRLTTRAGRTIALYWNPDRDEATFADGALVGEGVAWTVDDRLHAAAQAVAVGAHRLRCAVPVEGRIAALDRAACTIDVDGLRVEAGARIVVNPSGRGHTYRVEVVEALSEGRQRLTLDSDSLLGRGLVRRVDGADVELDHFIAARTGNLHATRLQVQGADAWAPIDEAMNPDAQSTRLRLSEALPAAAPETWVDVVDYVVGDSVRCEPLLGL